MIKKAPGEEAIEDIKLSIIDLTESPNPSAMSPRKRNPPPQLKKERRIPPKEDKKTTAPMPNQMAPYHWEPSPSGQRLLDEWDEEEHNPKHLDSKFKHGSDVFRYIYDKRQSGKKIIPYCPISIPYWGSNPSSTSKYYEKYVDSDEERDIIAGGRGRGRGGKKKEYTFKYKMAVIKEAFRTTCFQAADKFKLTKTQVGQWKNKYIDKGPQAFMRGRRKMKDD